MGRFTGFVKTAALVIGLCAAVALMVWLYGNRRFQEGKVIGGSAERNKADRAEVSKHAAEGDGPWLYRDILRRAEERP